MKKYLKSRFWYNKSQRNGIFFLIVLIVVLQLIYVFVDFTSEDLIDLNNSDLIAFQNELDSLKLIELEKRKSKKYVFNPNYISDFKGYQLGMNLKEIDRLHAYREKNKYVNSAREFQDITGVSDSLLNSISIYFKFPSWVIKRNKKLGIRSRGSGNKNEFEDLEKTKKPSTIDLNKAIAQDFEIISGVEEEISERILKYRNKLQGFTFETQLEEVWGLDKDLVNKILAVFKVIEKPKIVRINVNVASFKKVLSTPYIDYKLCEKIFDYRDEVAELQSISELKNIEGFPIEKYKRITLYLEAK